MVPFVFFILVASSSFDCPFAIFMNRSCLTTLKQRGVARWNNQVLVPIPPYSSGGGAQGLEDLHQGNKNVTTDMEKAEVLVESDEIHRAPGRTCKGG